jgi:hypothetical protein
MAERPALTTGHAGRPHALRTIATSCASPQAEQWDGVRGARASWRAIFQRCDNPNMPKFHLYGGRGITVYPQWRGRNGFKRFLSHIGPRPSVKHSLDRYPNVNGHYEPGNVRWATAAEQNSNRRNTKWLTYNGETLTLVEWSKRLGVYRKTIADRLRHGWSVELALTTPSIPKGRCLPRALREGE